MLAPQEHLRLAGLDTVLLDINRDDPRTAAQTIVPSSHSFLAPAALSPIVLDGKPSPVLRVARKPLGDKTPDLNVMRNSIASTTSRHSRRDSQSIRLSSRPPTRKPSNSLINSKGRSRTLSRSTVHPTLPAVARTSTFSVLPPLVAHFDLSTSSPRSRPQSFIGSSAVPAAIDATTTLMNHQRRASVASSSSPPSSLLHRLSLHLRPEPLVFPPLRSTQVHDEPYAIPTLQHPNSPYLPWASTIRHQILRPLTPASHISIPDGCYSRPLSRSGARAPSPIFEHDGPVIPIGKAKKPFGQAGRKVRSLLKNVGTLAKRVTKRKTNISALEIATVHDRDTSTVSPSIIARSTSPKPRLPLPVLPSPSIHSLLAIPELSRPSDDSRPSDETILDSPSSDFRSLDQWLEERRRLDESVFSGSVGGSSIVRMTLEEYEMRGSWLRLVPKEERDHGWACGLKGCVIHGRDSGYFASEVGDGGRSLHFHEEEDEMNGPDGLSEGGNRVRGHALDEEGEEDAVSGVRTLGTLGHTDGSDKSPRFVEDTEEVHSVLDGEHGIMFPRATRETSRSEEGHDRTGERQRLHNTQRVFKTSV